MPIHPLVLFPDPRLRQPAASVVEFDQALADLARDLLDTLHAAPGIGITAPHIGVLARLVVIELPGEDVRVYVNPRIVAASTETQRHEEGSISMPGVAAEIERPSRVTVAYQALDGHAKTEDADGLLAVCLQHEIDQLDGIFWIQRLSRLKRDLIVKRFAKLRR